jgi:hypothetical protein
MIKSLWASVQGNPVFMRRVNGWLTMFWLAMIPVSLATGAGSRASLTCPRCRSERSCHLIGWQAARVEVYQQQEDIAGDVVEAVVEKTDVERT